MTKINWIWSGDRNSRFLHAKSSVRKARNRMIGLLDDNGSWCDSKVEMEDIISNYFTGLFTSSNPKKEDIEIVTDGVTTKLPDQMVRYLEAKFMASDVRKAVFDMHPTNAPEKDGLFYHKFWDKVGPSVTA
ncbi:hypothetical protein Dsin_021903 [Dipteronia sinensis]|uniref:Uncharacterized protein n=1 Tax=Dipteronia sinensis TaxID=43782 RepID=A0AAE0DZ90_9ROSI|nr:hypothetical protein Dsin_021903 [Dipteronia sinensis]